MVLNMLSARLAQQVHLVPLSVFQKWQSPYGEKWRAGRAGFNNFQGNRNFPTRIAPRSLPKPHRWFT